MAVNVLLALPELFLQDVVLAEEPCPLLLQLLLSVQGELPHLLPHGSPDVRLARHPVNINASAMMDLPLYSS